MSEPKFFLTTDELEEGGFLKIEGNQVIYVASKIRRNITNPEERVRAEYYLELIKKYKYSDTRIQPNKNVPGRKPDYKRGKIKGEVKNWKHPVDSGVIREASKRKVKEIVSKSGFTKPAENLAKKKGIKLIKRGKKV